MAWTVKNLPEVQLSMQETQVRLLGWKDPLEKEMATYSSICHGVAWTAEPGGLQSKGSQKGWTQRSD